MSHHRSSHPGRVPRVPGVAASTVLLLIAMATQPAHAQQRLDRTHRDRTPAPSQGFISEQPTALSHGNIAALLVAADESAVKDAKLAETKATSSSVRELGKSFESDHTALESSAVSWMKAKNVQPVENSTSRDLESQSAKTRKKLETMQGPAFDRAYLSAEIRSRDPCSTTWTTS